MGTEWLVAALILILLLFVATIDIAFSHVTDVAMRRLSSDEETAGRKHNSTLLRGILENRARFRFLLSSAIQIFLIGFGVVVTVSLSPFFQHNGQLLLVALGVGLIATVVF